VDKWVIDGMEVQCKLLHTPAEFVTTTVKSLHTSGLSSLSAPPRGVILISASERALSDGSTIAKFRGKLASNDRLL
jgi:hypothetical protein